MYKRQAFNKGVADQAGDLVASFTNGQMSNTVNNAALASAIERYMEKKWPNFDITTVNLRYYAYTNTASTAYKFEAFYVTTKKSTGECKYNSCYGNGTKSGSTYSINFFNSMTAEKLMDCGAAAKVRNR